VTHNIDSHKTLQVGVIIASIPLYIVSLDNLSGPLWCEFVIQICTPVTDDKDYFIIKRFNIWRYLI